MSRHPDAKDLLRRSWTETQVVAHRGASADAPENTVSSFEEAVRTGAPATECDVRLSRDGRPVVIHDSTLDRTTALSGPVAAVDHRALIDAGVPDLDQVAELVKGRIVLAIEIKERGLETFVVDCLAARQMAGQCMVFAFDAEVVARTRQAAPDLVAVWLAAEPTDLEQTFQTLRACGADALGVRAARATPELAQRARELLIPLFVWTVPPGPEVERLRRLRANFIITDHPRQVLEQLATWPR